MLDGTFADAGAAEVTVDEVPELVERVFANKGADGSALRALRNHLVFVWRPTSTPATACGAACDRGWPCSA